MYHLEWDDSSDRRLLFVTPRDNDSFGIRTPRRGVTDEGLRIFGGLLFIITVIFYATIVYVSHRRRMRCKGEENEGVQRDVDSYWSDHPVCDSLSAPVCDSLSGMYSNGHDQVQSNSLLEGEGQIQETVDVAATSQAKRIGETDSEMGIIAQSEDTVCGIGVDCASATGKYVALLEERSIEENLEEGLSSVRSMTTEDYQDDTNEETTESCAPASDVCEDEEENISSELQDENTVEVATAGPSPCGTSPVSSGDEQCHRSSRILDEAQALVFATIPILCGPSSTERREEQLSNSPDEVHTQIEIMYGTESDEEVGEAQAQITHQEGGEESKGTSSEIHLTSIYVGDESEESAVGTLPDDEVLSSADSKLDDDGEDNKNEYNDTASECKPPNHDPHGCGEELTIIFVKVEDESHESTDEEKQLSIGDRQDGSKEEQSPRVTEV